MRFRQFTAVLGRIMSYIGPYWKIVSLAFFFTLLVTIGQLSQAKFVGLIFGLMTEKQFNYLDGRDPFFQLNLICGLFLLMIIGMGFANYFQRYLINLGGQRAIRDFRNHVFSHLQSLSLSFYDRMRIGEIHSRASGDIMTATQVYTQLADFAKNFLIVVVAMGWMLYRDWQMTALVLLLSPLIARAVSGFGHHIGQATESLQARAADLAAIMYESIASIKVVKAYGREQFEIERFRAKNEESFETQMRLVRIASSQNPVVEFLGALGIVAIVWFGATRILQGLATFAQMTEYWTLLVMTTQPINALSSFYSNFQGAAAAGKRVFEILDTPPEVVDSADARPLEHIEGRLRFEQLSFGYEPGKSVLKDLNLEVAPGEVLAIVGENGAGKTSLVNLVPRFYDPHQGRVTVDGHDLREVTLRSLRSHVGSVIQESVLFGGTIADNIACGNTTASRADIEQAARTANAHEFIEKLPEGYETQVGERGMRLSGGQRQRIAIARALLRDPKILILDEFTSGIDPESENLITDAIEKSMRGRTCLVIAHRLNTIRHAHRIIVLEAGRIVEQGTHADLVGRGGLYSRYYQAQLKTPGSNGEVLAASPG